MNWNLIHSITNNVEKLIIFRFRLTKYKIFKKYRSVQRSLFPSSVYSDNVSGDISDHPLSKQWLDNFDSRSVPQAKIFLRSLKLINESHFYLTIQSLIEQICEQETGKIAIFPIFRNNKSVWKQNKSKRYSSGDLIGYIAEGLKRKYSRRLSVAPTME